MERGDAAFSMSLARRKVFWGRTYAGDNSPLHLPVHQFVEMPFGMETTTLAIGLLGLTGSENDQTVCVSAQICFGPARVNATVGANLK